VTRNIVQPTSFLNIYFLLCHLGATPLGLMTFYIAVLTIVMLRGIMECHTMTIGTTLSIPVQTQQSA